MIKKWQILVLLLGAVGLTLFLLIRRPASVHLEPTPRSDEPFLACASCPTAHLPHYGLTLYAASTPRVTFAPLPLPTDQAVLLTLEMWRTQAEGTYAPTLLREIASGKYDAQLKALCEQVLAPQTQAYLRWNPEMEVPVNRYPWQNQPPDYISAFRHLHEIVQQYAPQTQLVWGPAAYPGALEFWPGAEYVDAISLTLKGATERLSTAYPQVESVEALLEQKLHRLRFVDKPLLILGSDRVSSNDFQAVWIEQIKTQMQQDRLRIQVTQGADYLPQKSLQVGLFDPHKLLLDKEAVTVVHFFTDFEEIDKGSFKTHLDEIRGYGKDIILTVEPKPSVEPYDTLVLDHILAGQYDNTIARLYEILAGADRTVYLRFAHEMEIPIKRYPWQSQSPRTYIRAFRYFMQFTAERPPHLVRVWGPAGDRGSLEFYPGDDVVDLISIAIYGLPDKNITDPEQQESFRTIYNRKSYRMRFVDKPIFITEFGVKGPEAYQLQWLKGAAETIRANPQIVGVNYFNMVDNPKVWGEGIKAPDWSITEASFDQFVEWLK